jgi:hypothetical protein
MPLHLSVAWGKGGGEINTREGQRMSRQHWIAGAMLVGWAVLTGGAQAASLSDQYLEGRWTTGSVDNCKKAEHEQTVFRKDGTFATEHSGKALAVGFWRIDDDRLELIILSTEGSLPQDLQDALPGDFHALDVKGLAFDVTDNGFRLVQGIAGEIQGLDMVRCPAS